jgi:hypothetical protein
MTTNKTKNGCNRGLAASLRVRDVQYWYPAFLLFITCSMPLSVRNKRYPVLYRGLLHWGLFIVLGRYHVEDRHGERWWR